ncbi:outer membrane beta-barrel protein [Brachyspira aalborgi]|uniref:PorT family protein n=1 Tax=Brachyspira aalborgi TaxID=29522 RepID=A0A5C8CEW4_9SPIR|nr:outer membrane beta-barrel protein [Brachyspira aalborgi]TXJ11183.1 PorT family protein [Brachyspira aalborgi]
MKNIKKFIVIMAMTMIFSVSAFAASGFEFILNVPLGLGIGIPTKSEKDIKWKSGIGFDTGVTAQLGYMFQVKSGFGISVLGELGYAHTTRAITQKYEELGIKTSIYAAYIMDSFQIGLLPKINIGAFAIGIGGGVKIPVAFQLSSKAKIGDTTIKGKEKIDMKLFRDNYSPAIIGYIKGTFDYSIFFTDKLAFNIGLYLGYDMLKTKATPELGEKSEIEGVFDIGIELGLKFGPKA